MQSQDRTEKEKGEGSGMSVASVWEGKERRKYVKKNECRGRRKGKEEGEEGGGKDEEKKRKTDKLEKYEEEKEEEKDACPYVYCDPIRNEYVNQEQESLGRRVIQSV